MEKCIIRFIRYHNVVFKPIIRFFIVTKTRLSAFYCIQQFHRSSPVAYRRVCVYVCWYAGFRMGFGVFNLRALSFMPMRAHHLAFVRFFSNPHEMTKSVHLLRWPHFSSAAHAATRSDRNSIQRTFTR